MVDFIGIGAQKSGTSWAYANIYEHPEICAPIKELHFFSRPRFEKGKDWYESNFRSCRVTSKKGEFSTSYLYSKETPKRIHDLYPNAKLIAILRNPRDRAYSQYRNAVKAGEIKGDVTFEEYSSRDPSVYEQGLYAEQLDRYLALFPREQILILIYEDIEKDPAAFMKRIYEFIGVNKDFMPSMLHRRINVERTPRFIFVEKIMHKIAEGLRRSGFDRFVWFVRLSGLPDMIRAANTTTEKNLSDKGQSVPAEMKPKLLEDISRLSMVLNRDMAKEWSI